MVHKGQALVGIACFLFVASLAEASASAKVGAAIDASKTANADDDKLRHTDQAQMTRTSAETASNHLDARVATLEVGQSAFW